MIKIICSECGELSTVYFDGYGFGDRMLEGVMFKVSKDSEGEELDIDTVDSVKDWDTDPYLEGLNKEYWMEKARWFAPQIDIGVCPFCGDTDVEVYE